ncbi:MAG: Do family serine endopeptidase [Bdellovibrionaceae bacterium]|nr:Do family serine endopeptidase [Pseudobdellovibrionaceae bacterium]
MTYRFFSFIAVILFSVACHAQKQSEVLQAEKIQLPKVEDGQPLPSNLFIELAKKTNPSVVNIYTETRPKFNQGQVPDSLNFFFEQFFGAPRGSFQNPQIRPMQSLGTGFVIRNDGLILTNAHVVDKADTIKVKFQNDETEHIAKLIGSDAKTDVALLKIDTKNKLAALKLGDSSQLQVGEWVAAFGNPYGHSNTITKGIVSALERDSGGLNLFPFIQTDASINPGNSGGPLVNMKGEVVGMNTAIDARAQGIGFSIPINNVKQLLSELEKTGTVQRGFLGIEMHGLDESIAASLKLPNTKGALVANVMPDSPAEKAGIKPYDVIVEFNGQKIESPNDIQRAVASTPVGRASKVKVLRNGKSNTLSVIIGSSAKSVAQNEPTPNAPQKQQSLALKDFGLSVSLLDNSLLNRFGLSPNTQGILVTGVDPYSPAFKADLRAGDVILELNRSKVTTVSDFQKRLQDKNLLRIQRDSRTLLTLMSK